MNTSVWNLRSRAPTEGFLAAAIEKKTLLPKVELGQQMESGGNGVRGKGLRHLLLL